MKKFQVKIRKRHSPDAELLQDLKHVAQSLGKNSLTALEYTDKGNFGVRTVLRKFGQ
jgi:hypothetical protein